MLSNLPFPRLKFFTIMYKLKDIINKVHCADCIEFMKNMPDKCVDTIITDHPAGISFMGKDWDSDKGGKDQWIAWLTDVMKECLRVAKPGATALVWAIPRTSHWTATAIENAGWEVRDVITHLFGSGFPKATDISKQLDKGYEREVIGENPNAKGRQKNTGKFGGQEGEELAKIPRYSDITSPATPEAKLWNGWKSHGLKPASEHWIMAVKPNEGTYAQNALKWGVSGLNIDGGRINLNGDKKTSGGCKTRIDNQSHLSFRGGQINKEDNSIGRFPANLVLSCECDEVIEGKIRSSGGTGKINKDTPVNLGGGNNYRNYADKDGKEKSIIHTNPECPCYMLDEQQESASRFFYCAKASRSERNIGLDRTAIVSIMKVWKENNTIKEERLAELLVDMDISQGRVIGVCGMSGKNDSEWNTALFGKDLMEKYPKDAVFITKTETNSITPLKIWNWLNSLLIKEYTLDVKYEMESGGNPAENAEKYKPLIIIMNEKMESRLGVKNVVLGTQLKISVKDGSNFHPTCKNLSLMEYLCILTKTPTGGIVLDPFAGSGSTLIAAKNTGRDFVGIEKESDYCVIANARIKTIRKNLTLF